jgi:intron-binding protein aquarius
MDTEQSSRSSRESTVPVISSQGDFSALHARPTVTDLHGENQFAKLARKHWAQSNKAPNIKPGILKSELWDELEKEKFAYGSLLILENLQIVEKYLWPGFSDSASNHHILLLAIFTNVKRREGLQAWGKSRCACSDRRDSSDRIDRSLRRQARRILALLPPNPFFDS